MLWKIWIFSKSEHAWVRLLLSDQRNLVIRLRLKSVEHGCYVKSDPRGPLADAAGTRCPSKSWSTLRLCTLPWKSRCSLSIQYRTDWLVASELIYGYSSDWNSQILAGQCVFLCETEELLEHTAIYQCSLSERAAKRLHAKNISHSLFSHAGFVVWICSSESNTFVFPIASYCPHFLWTSTLFSCVINESSPPDMF